jgi:hypothetical protein
MYLQNVGDVIPGGDDDGTRAMGIHNIVRPDLHLLTANLCHSRGDDENVVDAFPSGGMSTTIQLINVY